MSNFRLTLSSFIALSMTALAAACTEPAPKEMETPPVEIETPATDSVQSQNSTDSLQAAAEAAQTQTNRSSYLTNDPGPGFLTPENINASPALSGTTLSSVKIAPSGAFITVLQGREDDAQQQDLWAYDLTTGEGRLLVSSTDVLGAPEILSEEEKNRRERAREYGKGIVSYSWAGDSLLLFPLGGDIYIYDLDTKESRQITATKDFETDPKVSRDGKSIAYVRGNELYFKDLKTGLERQLSDGATDTIRNATASFVVQEELKRRTGYWVAPKADRIAYTQIDESPIAIENRLDFGAEGVKNIAQRYPFAGTANATVKLGVVSTKGGATRWLDLGDDKDIYLTRVVWSADGRSVIAGILSRDQKTHQLKRFDARSGKGEVIYTETSPTWLNIGATLRATNEGGLLWSAQPNDKRQILNIDSAGDVTALTPENLNVHSLLCRNAATGDLFVSGWRDTPMETHIFKISPASVNVEGSEPESNEAQDITAAEDASALEVIEEAAQGSLEGDLEENADKAVEPAASPQPIVTQITTRAGQNSARFNKDCSRYIGSFDGLNTPKQTRAFEADGTPLAWLNENALDETHPYAPYMNNHITPEYGQINAEDGTPLDYMLFKPIDLRPGEKRASVTIVYGGPGVQRVKKAWRNQFAQMLAHHGFVVFQLDNRGATNRGKAFEDSLYRSMGTTEVKDQAAGAAFLRSKSYIDPERMGVYGWSYGGYMTLHMLGQTEDYKSGVAGAPVTDWSLYDTAYTERFLGSPIASAENYTEGAYENGNVLAHLKGITEPILLIHGMADDNVVFRNSIILMDAMQKAGSQNLRVMTYPGEKHGFRNTANKIHRDRQILEFFLETLNIEN